MSAQRRSPPRLFLSSLLLVLALTADGGEILRVIQSDDGSDHVLTRGRASRTRTLPSAVHLFDGGALPLAAPSVPVANVEIEGPLAGRIIPLPSFTPRFRRDYPRPPPVLT